MYDFCNLKMSDTIRMGIDIRSLGQDCHYMENAAQQLVNYLFNNFVDQRTGENLCAMVRFYKTHDNAKLPGSLRAYVDKRLSETPASDDFKCLVLLATAGIEKSWNSRYTSKDHQAIPLQNEEAVKRIPMIGNMVREIGLDIKNIIQPAPDLFPALSRKTFNVFHLPEALNSPFIPAQDNFVRPYGIKSVVGYGGILPSGNMYMVIMFTRVPVRKEIANLFNTVALNVKMLILPFVDDVFA